MNVLAWNCRGITGASIIRALKTHLHKYSPLLVFLAEAKVDQTRCQVGARSCKFEGSFMVDAMVLSRGLWLMWKKEVQVQLLDWSKYLIHIVVIAKNLPCKLFMACAYNPAVK